LRNTIAAQRKRVETRRVGRLQTWLATGSAGRYRRLRISKEQDVQRQPSAATAEIETDDVSIQYGELNNHLGYFVRRAQLWIFRDVNSRLARLRLDVIRYSILEMVSANPGISQISLSGALGIERARLVALLDELQKLHFITRQRSTTDRRSHALQLTSEGRAAVKEANHLVATHEEKLIERIGPDAYPLLLAALSKFRSG
jgi:DNA-binding MarR family transcriptional regulator